MVNWTDKIRAAIDLGTSKGLRIEVSAPGMRMSAWRITHPNGNKIRIAGAEKLISYMENWKE